MIPATVDLEFTRGDREDVYFRAQEQVYDASLNAWVPGDYINLTGHILRAQVRATPDSSEPAAAFTVAAMEPQTDPEVVGWGVATLLPIQTRALVLEKYVWDLEVESDPQHIDTWFSGTITMRKDVTRA